MTESCHILAVSGSKLMEVVGVAYVFCDIREELPEAYEYLTKVEALLGKPIKERSFDLLGPSLDEEQWCAAGTL